MKRGRGAEERRGAAAVATGCGRTLHSRETYAAMAATGQLGPLVPCSLAVKSARRTTARAAGAATAAAAAAAAAFTLLQSK